MSNPTAPEVQVWHGHDPDTDRFITVWRLNDRLWATASGQPSFELAPLPLVEVS